jgi:glutamine cyclotransferase
MKIKRLVVIVILLLAVAGMVLVPMFRSASGNEDSDPLPAVFLLEENLIAKDQQSLAINIQVNQEEIAQMDLLYNDSLLQSWKQPKGKLTYQLKAGIRGLGTGSIELVSKMRDGQRFTDSRILTVVSDIIPEVWKVEITKEYPHNTSSFTQGLEFNNGVLYEGTGQNGSSLVAKVSLPSGDQLLKTDLEPTFFGEGITLLGEELFQITWQQQKCFVYNKQDLKRKKEFSYTGEGWGLCNDGKSLIMSDGSHRLTFRDPNTFVVQRVLEVFTHQGPVEKLNELEYVDGLIYANIWTTNNVAVIDAKSGKVMAQIDATELTIRKGSEGDVLNGIARDSRTGKWYMTGKNWPKIFEVMFRKNV